MAWVWTRGRVPARTGIIDGVGVRDTDVEQGAISHGRSGRGDLFAFARELAGHSSDSVLVLVERSASAVSCVPRAPADAYDRRHGEPGAAGFNDYSIGVRARSWGMG